MVPDHARSGNWLLRGALVVTDTFAVVGALGLAWLLRFSAAASSPIMGSALGSRDLDYVQVGAVVTLLWIALFALNRLYTLDELFGGPREYERVVASCSHGTFGVILLTFLTHVSIISRAWLILVWVGSITFVVASRFTFRRVLRYMRRRRGVFISRSLIVGTNREARMMAERFEPASTSGIDVVGFLDDFIPSGTLIHSDKSVIGRPSEISSLIGLTRADKLIVVPGALAWESLQEIIRLAATGLPGVSVKIAPGFYEILATSMRVDEGQVVPLFTIEQVTIRGAYAVMKVLLDYSLALALLIPATVTFLGAWATLRMLGCKPATKATWVMGRNGVQFRVRRLRTDCRDGGGNRTTTLRRFQSLMFRIGLDKIPEGIAVLVGHMSFVGPKEVPADSTERYATWLPTLLTVKPGITGPWASRGNAEGSPEVQAREDVYYVRRWSIWRDVMILFQATLYLVQGQRGVKKGETEHLPPCADASKNGASRRSHVEGRVRLSQSTDAHIPASRTKATPSGGSAIRTAPAASRHTPTTVGK